MLEYLLESVYSKLNAAQDSKKENEEHLQVAVLGHTALC